MAEVLEEPVYVEVIGKAGTSDISGDARVEYDPETNSVFVRVDGSSGGWWTELTVPWKTLEKVKKHAEDDVIAESELEIVAAEGAEPWTPAEPENIEGGAIDDAAEGAMELDSE